ncbi:MAG: phosphoribosylformylglycinamidine synthase subunit PurL [Candidatus Norongarragalinales archaeon]
MEKPKGFFHRIEVGFKEGVKNPFAEALFHAAKAAGFKLKAVDTIDVYTLGGISGFWNLERVAKQLLADPLLQEFCINESLALKDDRKFDFAVEVGFKPGVSDNVGRTTAQAIKDAMPSFNGTAFTSRQYLFSGVTKQEAEKIISTLAANDLLEQWQVKGRSEFKETEGFPANPPLVVSEKNALVEEINMGASVQALEKLAKQRLLALTANELAAVKKKYSERSFAQKRRKLGLTQNATDVELESIAQTWSEHCKHKIFNATIEYEDESGKKEKINSLFKTFVKKSAEEIMREKPGFVLSAFKDNAGIFSFNKNWNVAVKVETHNSPCALGPYDGAVTGIVGVNRDILGAGLGARPIFNTDVFCFAPPDYKGPYPKIHPQQILWGVVRGIQDGGNKSGIATVNGSITFDDSFAGKPLVYCGTGGIMPAKLKDGRLTHEKKAKAGQLILMVGGRVGKDGIHGATFSSMGLTQASPASAVQIGDPFTQKKVIDLVMDARDEGLIESITDNGAGGLSSSVGEMAQQSNGAVVHVDKVPLKYSGLAPWEIFLSESQERMTLAIKPENRDRFFELARKHEVEASEIGVFTNTGVVQVMFEGKTIGLLELEFIHNPPQLNLKATSRKTKESAESVPEPKNHATALKKILSGWNVCSKEEIVRRYDHEVQALSVIKPFEGAENDGPSDAAAIKPLYDSQEGLVIANGLCPKYSKADAYLMAANALDEAIRNCVATGASLERMVCLDNFCWPDPLPSKTNPDAELKLGDLVKANKALYEYTKTYGVPCVSGKDSMKNDAFAGSKKISVLPTLLFTVVAKIPDVSKTVSMDFKKEGDAVFILGKTKNELGESEYYASLGKKGGFVPRVNAEENKKLYNALSKAIEKGVVASAHDCSDGGLAVAIAESAFAGGLGVEMDLRKITAPEDARKNDVLLYSESAGRFVVSVSHKNAKEFEETMKGTEFAQIGVVKGNKLSCMGLNGKKIIDEKITELKNAWKSKRWF